jgi:hypothetical protein
VGSPQIGQWIAALAFPILLIVGFANGELKPRSIVVFAIVGVAAWVGLPRIPLSGSYLVTPVVAVLDIALVLIIFKRDIRIG